MKNDLIPENIINYALCCKIIYIRPNYRLGLLGFFLVMLVLVASALSMVFSIQMVLSFVV